MPPRQQDCTVMCRCKCYTSFTENEKLEIFHSFNRLKNHETQNLYLRGCVNIIRTDVVRRRFRNEGAVERKSFSYSVTVGGKTTKVCQAAFLGLHGIKRSRLQKKVLNFSDKIGDKRGKHDNHMQVEATVKERVFGNTLKTSQLEKAATVDQRVCIESI